MLGNLTFYRFLKQTLSINNLLMNAHHVMFEVFPVGCCLIYQT